jgi:hypothetical protein
MGDEDDDDDDDVHDVDVDVVVIIISYRSWWIWYKVPSACKVKSCSSQSLENKY